MWTLDVITGSSRREEAGSVQGDMGSRYTEERLRRQKQSRDMEVGGQGRQRRERHGGE